MTKRLLVHMTNGQPIPLTKLEGVQNKKNVLKVWSVLKSISDNTQQAEEHQAKQEEAELLEANLQRGKRVTPEDFVHDWVIKDNQFHIYSKTVSRGEDITLLLEVI